MKKFLFLLACLLIGSPAFAGTVLVGRAANAVPGWFSWDTSYAGTALSLTGFTQTFNDNFSTNDICNNGSVCAWYPTAFSYGNSTTATYPSASYSISGGVLSLSTIYSGGSWVSGGLQSLEYSGVNGFQQAVPNTSTGASYFEASIKFPYPVDSSSGAWPAFWLNSNNYVNPSARYAEIDAVEAYELSPTLYAVTAHQWIGSAEQGSVVLPATETTWDNTYHKIGVKITNSLIIAYLDRVEVGRFPVAPVDLLPMYIRLNNALSVTPSDTTTRTMLINNVSAYLHP